jgi:heme-degrading monooxygenase HmoA
MLLEKSEISVRPGTEQDFLKVMQDQGLPILAGFPGVLKVELGRGVENPEKFVFLVEWKSLDDHAAFNQHEIHDTFLALFAPYAVGGAMEHFEIFPAG